MRKLALLVLAAALFAAPRPASAGFFVEGSVGVPMLTGAGTSWGPANLMLTPGYEILWASAEVGFLKDVSGIGAWGLRPMVGLRPPLFPLYGKVIFDFYDLSGSTVSTVGGAIGGGFSLLGLGIFLEGDYIPRQIAPGQSQRIIEFRLGVSFGH